LGQVHNKADFKGVLEAFGGLRGEEGKGERGGERRDRREGRQKGRQMGEKYRRRPEARLVGQVHNKADFKGVLEAFCGLESEEEEGGGERRKERGW
jgi:hypothetical protein